MSWAGAAFGLAAIAAVTDWCAIARSFRSLEYIAKPATLSFLIFAAIFTTSRPHDMWAAPFFIFALSESLIGDVCLMLPANRYFVTGLIAFLLAHIAYIAGLNPSLPPAQALILVPPVAFISGLLLRSVVRSLRAKQRTDLITPVAVYTIAISMMLVSAWATLFRPEWLATRRVLVIAGGSLFFLSDAMLAWDRFVTPSPSAGLRVMVTYHLAQFALAGSLAESL